MIQTAKLIHKTYASYLPTSFPAHYYGMPNGKIFLVFSRFYEADYGDSGLEFVFAEHKEFYYNYENETIIPAGQNGHQSIVFAEQVDAPAIKIDIFNVTREINSYGEALVFLNQQAGAMMQTA